ncbi:antiviral helicase [Epithele typhae]|uniref:antiviral helicase n=1 Tax=Epithele typhae TaxID=378194 RepID=UPI0020078837|nr:antiviral helicase [Epithele typhae]KAH9920208.1 antiviral helicase [Epithele typhae]
MIEPKLIHKICIPSGSDADELLAHLRLANLPTKEQVHDQIERNLLLPRPRLPDHWLPKYQLHWETKLSIPSLLKFEPSPPPTSLAFVRTGLQGRVTDYTEVANPRVATGLTSTALDRAPAPSRSFVRGKSSYIPFLPGGLDVLRKPVEELDFVEGSSQLRTRAPGLSRGLRLPGEVADEADPDFLGLSFASRARAPEEQDLSARAYEPIDEDAEGNIGFGPGTSEIDELLPTSRSQLNPVRTTRRQLRRANVQKRDWAHEVDINKPMTNFHELVPEMAHEYPFELDTFQKEAVYHLEMGDSVFIAAHTSAGKTVVAEYAIALAGKHMTRAIYTSPIKALSNQKYRDFKQTFSAASVGILTGDVQINPEGNCLIMTTEILRSMLYKGADLIRDVEFVIFDEVHYVNDAERGVVWEEVIIMLPDHVNIILLSATVPNCKEFADWVGRTKKKDIYVISTAKRPVPLEHFLYANRDLHKIVDADRKFITEGYKAAGEALRRKQDKEREAQGLPPVQRVGARGAAPQRGGGRGGRGAGGGRGGQPARGAPARGGSGPRGGGGGRSFHQPDKNLYPNLLDLLKKKTLLPVVIFTFSKKRCEENAGTLTNKDLSTASEKSEIHVAIAKALSRLKGSDKQLPQIRRMRELLLRGIGVHHGGLLPIVKEVVEILFARGLIKVLFATETFAMGVNMPAKSVVFSHIRKHDGRSFREILPGEYTQMAGRAGRRGLDSTGTVIIVASDGCPEQGVLDTMILGVPNKLQSQFRLTYNMILNLLRVEALRVEEMIKRSFSENASQRMLPENQKKVIEHEKKLAAMTRLECDVCTADIEHYYDTSFDIVEHNDRLLEYAVQHGGRFMSPKRVVILRDGLLKGNAAIYLKVADATMGGQNVKMYTVLVLVESEWKKAINKTGQPGKDLELAPPHWPITPESLLTDKPTYYVTIVPLSSICLIADHVMEKLDLGKNLDRMSVARLEAGVRELDDVVKKWARAETIPEVHWGRTKKLDFQEALTRRDTLARTLPRFTCTSCPDFEAHYAATHARKSLEANIADLKAAMSDQNLELIPDYEQRIEVLQELKFIDDNSTVLLKGRVACEINSANELVLTELILENTFAAYEPEEVVALLSCFLFQEKTDVEPVVPPKLQDGLAAITAIAERVERVQDRHKVPGEEFRQLKPGLVEVVYEWAKGMPFEQITELTDVAEGTIVRVITRLDETCREVRDAARVIGDAELFKKMEEAQIKIKRDIVFAASLYF